jgi:ribulose-bisphosphate carboxylase small chain
MSGHPMFDNPDAAAVIFEVNECRKEHGGKYIRVIAFDESPGWESVRMSVIVNRPASEPGFCVVRQEGEGRSIRYTIESHAMREPAGARYA